MSDYLWDGSGEPDEDIEDFERLLGELRHRQEPPAMPLVSRPRRAFQWPGLAVAATLIIAALALGLWWGLRHEESRESSSQATASLRREAVAPATPAAAANSNGSAPTPAASAGRAPDNDGQLHLPAARDNQRQRLNRAAPERRRITRFPHGSGLSNSTAPATIARAPAPQAATQADRIAGEQARAQLMLALQITSERLNFAQRRVQEQPANAPALAPTQRERLR